MDEDYIESVIAEAAQADDVKTESTEQEAVVETKEEPVTEPEGQTGEPEAETQHDEVFPKKAVNAIARRDKKLTKAHASLEAANARIRELESRMSTPEPKEEDFEGKPYGEYLNAAAKHAAQLLLNEQAIEAAKNESKSISSEYEMEARAALDESGARAESIFPDFKQVIESHATHDRGDGNKVLPLSPDARAALQRSDDGAAAIYAILKDGALSQFNSLPLVEAAMMVKEYEFKAQSLPKIKHVSNAPEPITSARGVASGSKSFNDMTPAEAHAFLSR